jgi:CyaY protein
MAAERSAWHFDWAPEQSQWIALKTGDELWSTVERVLSEKLGHAIQLARRA